MTDWQFDLPENSSTLPNKLKNLMQSSSLTNALTQYHATFDVELRYLGLLKPNQQVLDTNLNHEPLVFVRDVFLRLNQIPVVWAISRCHQDDDIWRPILNRGNQSLGHFLFEKGPNAIQRSPFTFCYQKHPLCPNKQHLWARRSTFVYHGAALNLQEVFLPALIDFI